ncbi:MAG: hypothetical protein IJT80_08040 [Lachnospiraceae bacterium]|nr:hypothetical protein [Lachnospiraceae bacterium]
MAYKISYKVAAEQAEQLKNIAKDMDNYVNQLNQIVGKLGNDELFQSVRNDLNKFKKQLEEEKTVLNLASSVISDVIQSFSGVEKKSVGKVDKAKAHNRDFYKRPVAVASAGGGAAAGAAAASHVSVSTGGGGSSVIQQQNISHSTTNFNFSGASGSSGVSAAAPGVSAVSGLGGIKDTLSSTVGAGVSAPVGLAAAGVLAAGGAVAGAAILNDVSKEEKKEEKEE